VTPPEFFGLQPGFGIDITLPLTTQPPVIPQLTAPDYWWMLMMGRLNPGVSAAHATAVLDTIFKQSAAEGIVPSPNDRSVLASIDLAPGGAGIDSLRQEFSRPLLVLMGMVVLVLLIACANVANLLLARSAARQREIGIRLSIGASRGRLIRQLLTESAVLAFTGGAAGSVLAWWSSGLLVTWIGSGRDGFALNVSPDLRMLGFTSGACVLTALLFGLVPALRATRLDLTPALKRGERAAPGREGRVSLGKALVAAQTALCVVLLFGAGLFVRTLVNLHNRDIGFEANNVLLFGIDASRAGYKGQALDDFYARVRQRVAALPGVISATASLHLLLSGSSRSDAVEVPGYIPKAGEKMNVRVMPAGPDFFTTMKIPLLRGRDFNEGDTETSPKIAVVNEAFAKRWFEGRDPIGQRIAWPGDKTGMEIVGVARDAKYDSLRRDAPATVYHPFRQARVRQMHYEVRTSGDPKARIADVRQAVAAVDRNIPLFDVKTQTEQIDEMLSRERLFARLSGGFGVLALVLACAGLYGVLSYTVARRTGEIGIRLALGAQRSDIRWMVLSELAMLVGAGLAIGIPAALGLARLSQAMIWDLLFGLKPADMTSLIWAAVLPPVVAMFSGLLPARRASTIDPMVAIRDE
jgi:predicted permease